MSVDKKSLGSPAGAAPIAPELASAPATRIQYVARYENIHLATAAAKLEGWTDGESVLDYVEASNHCTVRVFTDKAEAEAWLILQINALHSCFGMGEIVTIEQLSPRDRCRGCICRGSKRVARVIVDDEGICDDEEDIDDCI